MKKVFMTSGPGVNSGGRPGYIFSHIHVHLPHQSGQDLPSSCQKRENPNISKCFFSTAGISSISLAYTIVVNNQHGLEETANQL